MIRSCGVFLCLALSSIAWAADAPAPVTLASAPNVVVSDLDKDGVVDLAIGIRGKCGTIEIWLTSMDEDVGLPTFVTRGSVDLGPATLVAAPARCSADFGTRLMLTDKGEIGTLPDRSGDPTMVLSVSKTSGKASVRVSSVEDGGVCSPEDDDVALCEPCCGDEPCCVQPPKLNPPDWPPMGASCCKPGMYGDCPCPPY